MPVKVLRLPNPFGIKARNPITTATRAEGSQRFVVMTGQEPARAIAAVVLEKLTATAASTLDHHIGFVRQSLIASGLAVLGEVLGYSQRL